MKRALALVLMIIISVTAYADDSALDYELFYRGKNALLMISGGDYEGASGLIGCKEDGLRNFVEGNYSDLNDVQTYVAVAYRSADIYYIAIPVYEPTDTTVPAFVFTSNDGSSFSGLKYMTWGEVVSAYMACDYVLWCEEYIDDDMQIIQ